MGGDSVGAGVFVFEGVGVIVGPVVRVAMAVAFTLSQSSWAKDMVAAWSSAVQEPCMQRKTVGTWEVHMQAMSRRAQEPWLEEMHVC